MPYVLRLIGVFVCASLNWRPNSKTCSASKHVQREQNINNPPLKEVMANSAHSEGDFAAVMTATKTYGESEIDLQLYFLPLVLKTYASVIAVHADAKVILNVRMIESDISPSAYKWADALLWNMGCQVSALITHWGWLRRVGRLVQGNSLCLVSADRLCCVTT